MEAVTAFYLEHLSDPDLAILSRAAGERGEVRDLASRLRAEPERIEALVESPAAFEQVFRADRDPLLLVSPALAFSILLAAARRDLRDVRFVREWLGPGRSVPVFDVEPLRDFLEDPLRRAFLAELLASYTHVTSGSVWRRTRRGWRRQRFSELDPVQLAVLVEGAGELERLVLFRRLGDLSLFLAGVFPDYAAGRLLTPVRMQRLRRVLPEEGPAEGAGGPAEPIGLLEELGRRAYRAVAAAASATAGAADLLRQAAERFREGRRILNFVAERYLFAARDRWFPAPGG